MPETATPVQGAALEYMARGWAVFPVDGKVPATTNGLHDASTEERLADIWYNKWPQRGVALATGRTSGVWVLDLDGPEGKEAFADLQREHGDLPKTVVAKTGGGWHLYWQMPEDRDVRNSASKVAKHVDVRGTGGYVVLPPSPHPDGGQYRWVEGRSPDDVPVAPAPQWLVDLVAPEEEARPAPAGEIPDEIPEGQRDQTLTSLAGSLRRRGASEQAILAAIGTENELRCNPPLPNEDIRRIASSVARYQPAPQQEVQRNGASPPSHDEPMEREAPIIEVVDADTLHWIAEEKEKPVDAVPTPWAKWNRVCGGGGGGQGLPRKWHVIVGAASGTGKSIAAMNLAATAIRTGHNVCLISLEMSRTENVTRFLSILSGQPVKSLEHGRFDRNAWDRATEYLQEQPGSLRTNPGKIATLPQIDRAVREQADQGARLVIIDYLQLAWVRDAETLHQQITEVSHVIQGLSEECDITTVGVSQVNRVTSSGGQKLAKEGLMGGSSLENDAEQVLLMSPPEREYDGFKSTAKLDKNRHGPSAEWEVRLDPTNLRMHEITLSDQAPHSQSGGH